MIAAVIDIQIAHDTTLSRKHETVISPIQWQVLHCVADHAIQPAYAVAAADSDLSPPTQVNQAAARDKSAQLAFRFSKCRNGFYAVVMQCRLRHGAQTFDYKEKRPLALGPWPPLAISKGNPSNTDSPGRPHKAVRCHQR